MTAKPVPEQISDELLAKMLAAAENAGGREWFTDPRPTAEGLAVVDDGASMWPVKCEWPQAQFVALANPAALIALLTELQHRREAEAGIILAQDVIDLVIAARMVAYEDQSPEAIRALDKAVEAFAERVGWENDPDDEATSALGEHP